MATGFKMTGILVVIVVAMIMRGSAAQTVHIVGNQFGWIVPTGFPKAYIAWAATQNFTVDDILVFNFVTGSHNVAQVTEEAFNSCNKSIPTISLTNTGPANITLKTVGENYFICTFSDHCDLGQKLAINVSGASSPGPATAPPPKSTPAPTLPPSASSAPPPPYVSSTPFPSRKNGTDGSHAPPIKVSAGFSITLLLSYAVACLL